MKRPLVWLAAAFAAAALLFTTLPLATHILPVAALAAAALVLLRLVPPAVRNRALVVCAAVLMAYGANKLFEHKIESLTPPEGQPTAVRMTVLSEEENSNYSFVTLYGRIDTPTGSHTTTVRAISYGIAGWQAGDKVEGTIELQLPKDLNQRRFLYSRGRFLDGRILQLQPLGEDADLSDGPKVWGAVLNRTLSDALTTALPGENGDFVQSVLLGRRERISDRVDENMRRSGAAHVMVVSGLHLSLICGAVLGLLRRGGANRWVQFVGGTAACLMVMAVAGFTPSVNRGGIMLFLAMAANLLHRQNDSISSLAAATLVMGLCNPYIYYSWSFLLSVGSMLSILVFVPPLQKALLKWRKNRFPTAEFADRLLSLAAVSLGAAVYTYPMLSVMFGGLPLYGLIGNLLITPFMGVLLVSAGAAAVLGAVGLGSAAAWVALPAGVAASLCRGIASCISSLPKAMLPITQTWQLVWLLTAALTVTLMAVGVLASSKIRRLAAACLAAVLLAGMASAALIQNDSVTLYTFEDSTSLVVVYDRQAVVIDADGKGADQAAQLADKQVLYTFAEDRPQQAALVLQRSKPAAAGLPEQTAREIDDYLPPEIILLDSTKGITLQENFSLTAKKGYTVLEIGQLRVLKLSDGYVIIENETEYPVADVVIDGQGLIYINGPQAGTPRRSLRLAME